MKYASVLLAVGCLVTAVYPQWLEKVIPVSQHPLFGCYHVSAHKTYTAHYFYDGLGVVSVVDAREAALLRQIQVGSRPFMTISNPVSNRVYCVNQGGLVNGSVSAIDPTLDSVVSTIHIGTALTAACVNLQRNRLYVGGEDGSVYVVDCYADTIDHVVRAGQTIGAVLWNSANDCVYCTDYDLNQVKVIDCARDSVVASISVGADPEVLCLSPSHNKVYCACIEGRMVTVIDAETNCPVDTIRAVNEPVDLRYNSRDDRLYIANYAGMSVTVVSCTRDSVVAVKGVGLEPCALSYDSLLDRVYCATQGDSSVWVIDGATSAVVRRVEVGAPPRALLWTPEQNRTYTSNFDDASVSVLRDSMPGIEGIPNLPAPAHESAAVVVRNLPRGTVAFDAMGRRVTDPKPGVYFVRDEVRGARDVGLTRKVVITR